MKDDTLKVYLRPETRVRILEFESTILSGNTEDPYDPGVEIDI